MNYFLLFFSFASIGMILVHKHLIVFIKNKTGFKIRFNSRKIKQLLLLFIGVFISIYYLVFKWGIGLEYLIRDDYLNSKWFNDSKLSQSDYHLKTHRNQIVSMVFLMDWCAALSLIVPLLVAFDRKKRFWKPAGLLSTFAAILTIVDYCLKTKSNWSFEYLFLGNREIWGEDDPLFFIMHYWMLVIGILFLMYTPKITLKDGKILLIGCFSYIGYVLATQKIFDCYSHTSALGKGDFFDYYGFYSYANLNQTPAYSDLAAMINYDENIWWVGSIVLYILSSICFLLLATIKNVFDFLFNPERESSLVIYKINIKNSKLLFEKNSKFLKNKKNNY